MMESSQPVLNPLIPENDNANEILPETEEPNDGLSEESKNEKNEQQEGGILYQVIEEEDPVKTLFRNEGEEPSVIPDTKRSVPNSIKENLVYSRRQSQRSTQLSQKSQPSAGRQSLPSPMSLEMQPPKDVGPKGSVAWLNQRTGKEMKCKFNQTSLIWERKPLAEILHPSSKRVSEEPEMSEDTGKDETDAGETVAPAQDTEIEPDATQGSAHGMQPLEGTEGQEGSPSPVIQESEHVQQPEEQASRHGSEHAIVTQPPQDGELSQLQPPNEDLTEGNIKLISKKTGQEMKSNFNQTSLIWERKPLAEILYPPSAKTLSPEKDTTSPEAGEIKQTPGQEVFPSSPEVVEQELQQGSQQLEAQESEQDGGQEAPNPPEEAREAEQDAGKEAPTEKQDVPEDAPKAPEEVLEVPEDAPKEALEAPEDAPKEALEAPEEAPEEAVEAPGESPETPEQAPETQNTPVTPEEASKEGPEAPEEPSQS